MQYHVILIHVIMLLNCVIFHQPWCNFNNFQDLLDTDMSMKFNLIFWYLYLCHRADIWLISHNKIQHCSHSQGKKWHILSCAFSTVLHLNTLEPRQKGCRFTDYTFKSISLNENFWILNEGSLKYAPYGLIFNMAAFVHIMAWHRTGAKPLSEAMLVCCIDTYMHDSTSMKLTHSLCCFTITCKDNFKALNEIN